MSNFFEVIVQRLLKPGPSPEQVLIALLINYTNNGKFSFHAVLRHHKMFAWKTLARNSNNLISEFFTDLNNTDVAAFAPKGDFAQLLQKFFAFYPHYITAINPELVTHLNLFTHPIKSEIIVRKILKRDFNTNKESITSAHQTLINYPLHISITLKINMVCSLLKQLENPEINQTACEALVSLAKISNTRFKFYIFTRLINKLPTTENDTYHVICDTAIKIYSTLTSSRGKNLFHLYLGVAIASNDKTSGLVIISRLIRDTFNREAPNIFIAGIRKLVANLDISDGMGFHFACRALLILQSIIPNTEKEIIRKYLDSLDLNQNKHIIWEGISCLIVISDYSQIKMHRIDSFNEFIITKLNPRDFTPTECALKALNNLVQFKDPRYFDALAIMLRNFDSYYFELVMEILLKIAPDTAQATRLDVLNRVIGNYSLTKGRARLLADNIFKIYFSLLPEIEQINVVNTLLRMVLQNSSETPLLLLKTLSGAIPEASLLPVIDDLVLQTTREYHLQKPARDALSTIVNAGGIVREDVIPRLTDLFSRNAGVTKAHLALTLSEWRNDLSNEIHTLLIQQTEASLTAKPIQTNLEYAKNCLTLKKLSGNEKLEKLRLRCLRRLLEILTDKYCCETRKIARKAFLEWLPCFTAQEKQQIVFPLFYGIYHEFQHSNKYIPNHIVLAELNNLRNLIHSHQFYAAAMKKHVLFAHIDVIQEHILDFTSRSRVIMGSR